MDTPIGLSFVLIAGLFAYSIYRYILVKDEASAQMNILQVNW